MRVLSQGRLARRIAQALLVAFLWSMTMMGAGTIPASAQISTRATTAQSIAVVPFENLTVCEPETLGAKARALVSDELQTRLMLDVLSSKDVDDAMAELGLKPPLPESDLVRLATELEVAMIVTGKITHAEVITESGQSYAEVTLTVALFDRAAGTTVNGATVTARSPVGATDTAAESLIDKALKQAAFLAVQEMKTRPTVTAMVLWAKGNEIFTNSGTRAGVTQGMYMVAIRGGQRIATVQITSAEATGSYGKIIDGSPLQTGDHLRAMYKTEAAEPGLFVHRVVQGAKKHSSRIEKVAVAAGILLGLAAYASSATRATSGNVSTVGLRVANLANGSDLGVSGLAGYTIYYGEFVESDPADPTQGEWFIRDLPQILPVGATLVTWRTPSGSQARRIAAYTVYRDMNITGVAFSTKDENWAFDTWSPPPGIIGAGAVLCTIDLDPLTGEVADGREADIWVPDSMDIDDQGMITFSPTYDEWLANFSPNVMNQILWSDTHIEIAWQVIGPYAPNVYQYRALPILIENTGDANFANWRFVQNNWSYTNDERVTAVAPPLRSQQRWNLTADKKSLDVHMSTSMEGYGVSGIDEMIVQLTRDQGPGQPISFQTNVSKVVAPLNPTGVSTRTVTIPVTELQALPSATDSTIYWLRIGGRNRADSTQPVAWPISAELNPGDPLHYDQGWVWWNVAPQPVTVDNPAPGVAAMKKDREVLTNSRASRVRIHRPNEGRELHIPR